MTDIHESSLTVPPLAAPAARLGPQDRAVLAVLLDSAGRVVSRQELVRRTGLTDRSERRCDAILVQLRRALGPDSIRTVRSRGWMLPREAADHARTLQEQ